MKHFQLGCYVVYFIYKIISSYLAVHSIRQADKRWTSRNISLVCLSLFFQQDHTKSCASLKAENNMIKK